MLDLKFVVANTEAVKQNCRNRNARLTCIEDVDRVVALEGERRALLQSVEEIRRRQNESRPGHRQGARPRSSGRHRSKRASA